MHIFDKTIALLFLAAMLVSGNSFQSTPIMSPEAIMRTAISTMSPRPAETQRAMPTATASPIPLFTLPVPTISLPTTTAFAFPITSPTPLPTIPTFTPLVYTDSSIPLSERIIYYYFVNPAENPTPEGKVSGLAPTYADETYTSDTAADLKTALEILLKDGRNYWHGNELEIVNATYSNGHADMALQGEFFAMGDGVRCIASRQILFTVFANPAVQTATVTLNGGLIGNLCFFGPPNPDDYLNDAVYTRAEIETFMKENSYVSP